MKSSPSAVVSSIANSATDRILTVNTVTDEVQDLNAEANLTFDGTTLTVAGNLNVTGTTTSVSTTNTTITDRLIELANGTTGTPSGDAGIIIERGDSDNAAIIWDESADTFVVGTTTATGSSSGDLSVTDGALKAGSLDISGDVDVDGTLEADAITVNGDTLAEVIQDTVGAMVGSNTETGITVSYEDSDGTLDFVLAAVGTNAIADDAVTVAKLEDLSRGQIIYGNASGETAKLSPGSNGQVLTSDGTDIAWQNASGGGSVAADDENLILHMQTFA